VLRTIAQGLLPMLPLLAANTGVDKLRIGFYMTMTYSFLLCGSWLMGKVAHFNKLDLKKAVLFSGLASSILLFLMGYASTYFSLCIVTACLWFFDGVTLTSLNILTGIVAEKNKAGKAFGILAIISLSGTILGGFIVGPAIQYLGNKHAFLLFAIINLATVAIALFINVSAEDIKLNPDNSSVKFKFNKSFLVILYSLVLATLVLHFLKIALSLSMKDNGYSVSQISLCVSYGTLMAFPFAYFMGSLSDKYSKKLILVISLSCGVFATLCYSFNYIYIFAILTTFFAAFIAYCLKGVISNIILYFYQDGPFKQALAWFDVTSWFGAILGYALSGLMLQYFGFKTIGYMATTLSVASVLIVVLGLKLKHK
jgi:MFS family permease